MSLGIEIDNVRRDTASIIRLTREKLDAARRAEQEALAELAELEGALRSAALEASRARRKRVLMAGEAEELAQVISLVGRR